MSYDYLDDDDIGFKLIDYGDDPDLGEQLREQPYFFSRSDIEKKIRKRLPRTLFLRSRKRKEDYKIVFESTQNMSTFLELFPENVYVYDDETTVGYYYMPIMRDR